MNTYLVAECGIIVNPKDCVSHKDVIFAESKEEAQKLFKIKKKNRYSRCVILLEENNGCIYVHDKFNTTVGDYLEFCDNYESK